MRRVFRAVAMAALAAGAPALSLWFIGHSATAAIPPPGVMVEAGGLRLHAVCAGAGEGILLIHGNPGSYLSWTDTVMPALAGRHRVCAVDRPGHGFSERGGALADSVEGQSRLLRAAAQGLGLGRPVLVGHSWGGAAALAYALHFPDEVAGLALLGTVAYPDDTGFGEGAERIALHPVIGPVAVHTVGPFLARPLLDRSLALSFAPAPVPAAYRDRVVPAWARPDVLRAISADNAALTPGLNAMVPRYAEIRAPAELLAGDADRLVSPRRHSFRLQRALPRAALTRLAGAGHELHHTHTALVVETISALRGRPL